jgi:hypothetical protein
LHSLQDLTVHLLDFFLQASQVAETTADQKSLVIAHAMSFQSLDQLLPLGLTSRQLGDLFGFRFPFEQSQQHTLSRDAKYIAEHISNLDIHMLQQLLDPIPLARRILYQLQSPTSQISQVSNWLGWDITGADMVMS